MSFKLEVPMVKEECIECHAVFAMTMTLNERLRKSLHTFYCPLGHSMNYKQGHSKLDMDNKGLKEQVTTLTSNIQHISANLTEAYRSRNTMLAALRESTPVGQMGLGWTATSNLLARGIVTLEALAAAGEMGVFGTHGIGPVRFDIIKRHLTAHGLEFNTKPIDEREET